MPRPRSEIQETDVIVPEEDQEVVTPEEDDGLEYNQVRLSDGRVVTVKEVFSLHEHLVEQFMVRGKVLVDLQGVGVSTYMRFCALCAIEKIDDRPRVFPQNVAQVTGLMATIRPGDMSKIVRKYAELNGLDAKVNQEDGTFPVE